MNRSTSCQRRKDTEDIFSIFLLMLICLAFLFLGNFLYHSGLLPVTASTELRLRAFIEFRKENIGSLGDFLVSVIVAARTDIFCVLLIAFSRLTRIPKLFTYCVFSYRSFLFGFCGACMIIKVKAFEPFTQGFLLWLAFFVYHIAYLAILICFGDATIRHSGGNVPVSERIQYILTVFSEIALAILLNFIYYFLISKI